MSATGAIAVEGDSGKDRRIYVRVLGTELEIHCYVIEEKSQTEPSPNEMPECRSERDRVRRLLLPDAAGSDTNNLAVLNSRVYLIGGDRCTQSSDDDESLGYRYLDLDPDLGVVEEWTTGGGKFTEDQNGGGVTVGHDGCVYSVGPTLYRLRNRSGVGKWEKLPIPQGPYPRPNGDLYQSRLLGITKNKLYLYREGGANVMLSFDLESGEWDDDVLDDDFCGDWSPGVVLYDRYLFTFGTRSPKRKPKPKREEFEEIIKRFTTWKVLIEVLEEEEVPGIYVFDLKRRLWLPEPVQGLPNDGTVMPYPYQPYPESPDTRNYPQLFQIRNDDDHHLALLWDSDANDIYSLIWCKFMLDVSPDTTTDTTTDDFPSFYAHSLSRGFCPLDGDFGFMLSCAVGM